MIRAYIHEGFSFAPDTVTLSIVAQGSDPADPRRILRLTSVGEGEGAFLASSWEALDGYGDLVRPTLSLTHDTAIAVMQALNTHYSGVDDQRLLRKDYTDERARVDKLTAALIDANRAAIEIARGRAA